MTTTTEKIVTRERTDLLESLGHQRFFLRYTVRDLTDAQASQATTASVLTLAGLIKHVTSVEKSWIDFVLGGADGMAAGADDRDDGFRMLAGETLAGLLDQYADVAQRTDDLVATLPNLDASRPLPQAPGFEPGAGPLVVFWSTSSPKPLSTPATPTSSASPWTAPRRWADAGWRQTRSFATPGTVQRYTSTWLSEHRSSDRAGEG
jgi:hypothetical protein